MVKCEYDQQPRLRPNRLMCDLAMVGEDRRLHYHPGVDPLALCRAAWRTYVCGRVEGGSTIAMQLVRTLTGRYERTFLRKAQEAALAIRLTRYLPRDELAGLYLWVAYYGWNMNNFRQACRRLGVDPASRDVCSAAWLVACLKYPQPKRMSGSRRQKIERRCTYLLRRLDRIKYERRVEEEVYLEAL